MKYALITGASRGIGAAIAEELAKTSSLANEKLTLYLVGFRSMDALHSLCNMLSSQYGVICKPYCRDVSKASEVESLFSEIEGIDILINNAGISQVGLLHDMTDEEWNLVLNTNLSSAFYTSKHAIPFMLKEHKGHIINISSVWGNVGASTEVAYSASKGGLNTFTKALAKELAPSNIQVNAVACGLIDTDMNSHLSMEEKQCVIDEIPACRMGTPDDVAKAVSSLLNMPEYFTGQIINIDGGWQ